MSTGPLWSDYKPPSNNWLKKSLLPMNRIRKALIEYAFAIGRKQKIDDAEIGTVLRFVDSEIGQGEELENRELGKMLHMRTFILQNHMDSRLCVRTVRRWDRRLIAALPKRDE